MTEADLIQLIGMVRDLPPDQKRRICRVGSKRDEWAEAVIVYRRTPGTRVEKMRRALRGRSRVAAEIPKFEELLRDLRIDGRLRNRVAEIEREGWTQKMRPDF